MNTAVRRIQFKKLYLEPENRMFSELMGNGKSYSIPRFQRDYSWDQEELTALWHDIESMMETETQHFMGYLVLQTSDGKSFQIIDGQQRLTTISLIIVAALNLFKAMIDSGIDAEENRQRLEAYRRDYLGVLDTVTLKRSAKITLNRHNDRHFRNLTDDMDVRRIRNLIETNRKMDRAFGYFRNELSAYRSGEALAGVLNAIIDGFLFTAITVSDDVNAYLVFETLNARGMQLSIPDMFKSYLISTLAENQNLDDSVFDDFDEEWEDILGQLRRRDFADFLRCHMAMRNELQPKHNLYRSLRNEAAGTDDVMPYLQELTRSAPIYAALQNHKDDFWLEYDEGRYAGARDHLEVLFLFNIKTPLSLLMAVYTQFDAADFIKVLEWIVIISIRYSVICGKPASKLGKVYNIIANGVMRGEFSPAGIAGYLRSVYPKDDDFQNNFIWKAIPMYSGGSRQIMFLLRKLERHLSGADEAPAVNLTIEHVLPRNPGEEWQDAFGPDNWRSAADRLGNMAILPRSRNMSQESFEEKRCLLLGSGYRINRHIAEYTEWNMESLEDHQRWLADQARKVWCSDALMG